MHSQTKTFVAADESRFSSQNWRPDVSSLDAASDGRSPHQVEEVGRFQAGPERETGTLSQQGSYQFVGDDGNTYTVSYVADERGFQPQGAHLPVAPAQIPEYAQLRAEFPQLFWAEGLATNQLDSRSDSFNQRGNQRAERR